MNFEGELFHNVKKLIKRDPTIEELAMFEVMHSEHCSYKSSKGYFKRLYTKNAKVLVGPGMDAGVVNVSDEYAAVFKIESHNHPSYIDPYNGSATGVGGIIRDVLAMGANPIGVIDSLHFGVKENGEIPYYSLWLFRESVRGIADYGNSTGIPNLGGEIEFDKSFMGNCLVNAGCIGIIKMDKLFDYSKVVPGDLVILMGNSTGKDGIGGVSFASKVIDSSKDMRPAVQIADPFTKKLIIDALQEIFSKKLVKACRDLGGGGLTSATTEFCAKFNLGMQINIEKVFLREKMLPWEILISESQERMLLITAEEHVKEIEKILQKYEINYSIIGKIMPREYNYKAFYNNNLVVDLDPKLLVEVPFMNRKERFIPREKKPKPSLKMDFNDKNGLEQHLFRLLSHYNVCSREKVFSQYDMSVKGNTALWPHFSAAVIKLPDENIGLSMSVQSNAFLCNLDPYYGTYHIFMECYRSIVSVFGSPLALSDNLNFGNPEKEDVMGDFSKTIDALADSGEAFDIPCIGGNVSFYNENVETNKPISPTPVIFMIGKNSYKSLSRIEKLHELRNMFEKNQENCNNYHIYLLMTRKPLMSGSIFYQINNLNSLYEEDLAINVNAETKAKEFILNNKEIIAVNDISRSGMIVSLFELTEFLGNDIGFDIKVNDLEILFGTYYGYVLIVNEEDSIKIKNLFEKYANNNLNDIKLIMIGHLLKDNIIINGINLDFKSIKDLWKNSLII